MKRFLTNFLCNIYKCDFNIALYISELIHQGSPTFHPKKAQKYKNLLSASHNQIFFPLKKLVAIQEVVL